MAARSKAQLWREAAVQLARRQRTRGLLEGMAQQEVNRRLCQEIARRQQHVSNRLICTGFHRILCHFLKCVQIKFHRNPKRGDGKSAVTVNLYSVLDMSELLFQHFAKIVKAHFQVRHIAVILDRCKNEGSNYTIVVSTCHKKSPHTRG